MKPYIALILSFSLRVLGSDSDLQLGVLGSDFDLHTFTNSVSGIMITTDIFTRDGQTNLIREMKAKNGAVITSTQRFYHGGTLLATFTEIKDGQDFQTEPTSPYRAHFTNRVPVSQGAGTVYFTGKDKMIIDMFDCTGGLYSPVAGRSIMEINQSLGKTFEKSRMEISQALQKVLEQSLGNMTNMTR